MKRKTSAVTALLAISASILLTSFGYGILSRHYISPPQFIHAGTYTEIRQALSASGARGRVALVFGRQLAGEYRLDGGMMQMSYLLEEAMQRGIIRYVVHLVPEWAEAETFSSLRNIWPTRPIHDGQALLLGPGRVSVIPLSRFIPAGERALAVVAPDDWSPEEKRKIFAMFSEGTVKTDFVAVFRGSDADADLFRGLAGRQ